MPRLSPGNPSPVDVPPTFEQRSPSLGEVVRDINKFSNNVMAQQLFLTLALQRPRLVAAPTTGLDAHGMKRRRHLLRHGFRRLVGGGRFDPRKHALGTVEKGARHDGSLQTGANTSHADSLSAVTRVAESHLPAPHGKPTLSA